MKTQLSLIALSILLVLLSICLLYSNQILQPEGVYVDQVRNTDGTVSFAVRTVTYGGAYAPRHVFAIWITNSSNQFVKSIKVCGQTYRSKLIRWVASSGNNTTGAITSASLNYHQLHNVTWNAQTYQNIAVPDGNYNINVEFAEHNATSSNLGKFKSIPITIGPSPVDTTPASDSWFTDMHLLWNPVVANGTISGTVTSGTGTPLNGAIITTGSYSATTQANGSYSLSVTPGTYNLTCIQTGYVSQTQNNVVVTSNQTTTANFVLNAVHNNDQTAVPMITLQQNYPNPFRNQTSIRYYLPKSAKTKLQIFNLRGQLIYSQSDAVQSMGWHEVIWNGRMSNGSKVPAGKYLYRLITDSKQIDRTLTYVE